MTKEPKEKKSTKTDKKKDELTKYFDLVEGKNTEWKKKVERKDETNVKISFNSRIN